MSKYFSQIVQRASPAGKKQPPQQSISPAPSGTGPVDDIEMIEPEPVEPVSTAPVQSAPTPAPEHRISTRRPADFSIPAQKPRIQQETDEPLVPKKTYIETSIPESENQRIPRSVTPAAVRPAAPAKPPQSMQTPPSVQAVQPVQVTPIQPRSPLEPTSIAPAQPPIPVVPATPSQPLPVPPKTTVRPPLSFEPTPAFLAATGKKTAGESQPQLSIGRISVEVANTPALKLPPNKTIIQQILTAPKAELSDTNKLSFGLAQL